MSDRTEIAWTDATWSPVSGCTKISDGCTNCYIDRTPPFRMVGRKFNGNHIGATTGVTLHSERLGVPQHWRKPRRIFVCSLADLFHDDVPDAFIAEVWAVMSLCPQHTFQVPTKRPARMRSLLKSDRFKSLVDNALRIRGWVSVLFRSAPIVLDNVWIGVTAENQHWANLRIPILLDTPAAVRWISAEPLLSPVDLRDCGGIDAIQQDWIGSPSGGSGCPHPLLDWVVVGGESGPKARPMFPDWARSLRDQCLDAGVPMLFKQHGEWIDLGAANDLGLRSGGEIRAYPGALLKCVGKKAAGRELDGRTWDQYPAAVPS